MSAANLLTALKSVAGHRNVLTASAAKRRFLHPQRFGGGAALAVVCPPDLVSLWRVTKLCVEAGLAIIMQAANTGLTGGSTPFGSDYGRDVVVINTMKLKGLQLIRDGEQVIAFPGSTLDELEKALKPFGREPHSVIGSSCLGASVIGGVCNNSGGSLIKRGPAYTEYALFARLDEAGRLSLVNHLGIDLGEQPEDILRRLDEGNSLPQPEVSLNSRASDGNYADHVRDVEAETPARYNADPSRLYEASGSAGKVVVFAVRLDTFPLENDTKVFYIGTNDPQALAELRRKSLRELSDLPIAAEYIHREAFTVAERYGKDTYLLIQHLGTANLPTLFAWKARFDALTQRLGLGDFLADRILQKLSALFPTHLPKRLRDFRDRYEHHLMVKLPTSLVGEFETVLDATIDKADGAVLDCTEAEGAAAFRHRFAVAGAAIRYALMHRRTTGGLVALDIALPRNTEEWVEELPADIEQRIVSKLYYGHFFCQVFHQDYILAPGEDWSDVEHEILKIVNQRGGQYPAEHNFGHLYKAPQAVVEHYRDLDPCNCLNPGIGGTTKHMHWHDVR